MKLVYTTTQAPVQVGDEVLINGYPARVEHFRPPHKPESSGKVSLSNGAEFYVSVIGAEWIEREDRAA